MGYCILRRDHRQGFIRRRSVPPDRGILELLFSLVILLPQALALLPLSVTWILTWCTCQVSFESRRLL